jgi:hypothetical protein
MRKLLGGFVAALALFGVAERAFAHGDVMSIGSTQAGAGQLRIAADFDFGPEVLLPLLVSAGGQSLYSAIIPSFAWIREAGTEGLFPLDDSVEVAMVLVAATAGASVRVGSRTMDDPGESGRLGFFDADPEAHVHPEWRLLLGNGVTGSYEVTFRLTTTAAGYSDSPVYRIVLTNLETVATPTAIAVTATPTVEPAATPTRTPSPTDVATATPTLSPTSSPTVAATATATEPVPVCSGDCNEDGEVTVDEIVAAVALALGTEGAPPCAAADTSGDGAITVEEIVAAIGAALEGCAAP